MLFLCISEENSTAALLWLRTELSLVTARPVLVAIDDVNSFHNPSSYYDMDHPSFAPTLLPPSKLSGFCFLKSLFILLFFFFLTFVS